MGSSLRVPKKWNRAGGALRRDGEYKASAASEDELGRQLNDARIAAVGQSVVAADVGCNLPKKRVVQRAGRISGVTRGAIYQIRKVEEIGPNLERHLFPYREGSRQRQVELDDVRAFDVVVTKIPIGSQSRNRERGRIQDLSEAWITGVYAVWRHQIRGLSGRGRVGQRPIRAGDDGEELSGTVAQDRRNLPVAGKDPEPFVGEFGRRGHQIHNNILADVDADAITPVSIPVTGNDPGNGG